MLMVKNISECLPDQFLNQVKFFFFHHAIPSISHHYYCYYCYCYYCYYCSSIITIIIVFVTENLTLSSLLPLSLVFLFFFLLLISLYLFVIVSYFHCCYSYQVTINFIVSIISFVNFLIYTFAFHL